MKNTAIYKKGEIYVSDVDGHDPVNSHLPTGTYIDCVSTEIDDYLTPEQLKSRMPYGHTAQECIYMVKTVMIEIKVKVKVID